MRPQRTPGSLFITGVAVALFVAGCGSDKPAEDPGLLAPPAPGEGFQLKTPQWTLAPGEEKTLCLYTTLPGEGTLWVNEWEIAMQSGSHHFIFYRDLSALAPEAPDWVEGFRECDMEFGVPLQGSQVEHLRETLPPGVATEMTGGERVILETHYINYTDETMQAQAWINGGFVDPVDVEHAAGLLFTYKSGFQIPAGAGVGATPAHVESMTCPLPDAPASSPEGLKFFSTSSHMHWHGREFNAWTHDVGLTQDIEHFYTNTDWSDPADIRYPDNAPLLMAPGEGFRFECTYFNDTGAVVSEGPSADDEMCMLLGRYYPAVEGSLGLGGTIFCFDGQIYY